MQRLNSVHYSLLFGLGGFLLDRAHKFYQLNIAGWQGGEYISVTGFFDYILVWNRGVSFGLFSNLPRPFLAIIIATALIILVVWWIKAKDILTKIALSLCLAGALSNIIDRFLYGAVADFFHFYWNEYSFYIFNLADVLISLGVMLLFLEIVLDIFYKKSRSE